MLINNKYLKYIINLYFIIFINEVPVINLLQIWKKYSNMNNNNIFEYDNYEFMIFEFWLINLVINISLLDNNIENIKLIKIYIS